MRFLSKLRSLVLRVPVVAALIMSGLTPMVLSTATVSAAACNSAAGGGGGGGILSLVSRADPVDSTVDVVGVEVTSGHAWGDAVDKATGSFGNFADGSCTYLNSYAFFTIANDKKLKVTFVDADRSGAFVADTDYKDLYSGVTFTNTGNTEGSLNYTLPSMAQDEAILVSADIATDGWVGFKLKIGSGSEVLLGNFLAHAGTAAFKYYSGFGPGLNYGDFDIFSACNTVTGSAYVKTRILADGTAAALTNVADGLCISFADNSYDAATKTATLGYKTSGVAVDHTIDMTNEAGSIKAATVDNIVSVLSSLELASENKIFKNYFVSGSGTSQQLYFGVNEGLENKALPKNTPWPIAGGVFDLSASVDLSAAVFDTSPTAYTAVAHNLAAKTKDGSFTLFIPYKTNDNFVGVCAGAATLTAVNNKCNGVYYLKDGQTKTSKDTKSIPSGRSVKATIVTIGAVKFWQVDGLTGSGGFSTTLAEDPDTGLSISAMSAPVAVGLMAVTLGLALTARRYAGKR